MNDEHEPETGDEPEAIADPEAVAAAVSAPSADDPALVAVDNAIVDPFEENRPEDTFYVDLEGFGGPLDLLLSLARTHKLDLTKISILALSEQYLGYIEAAQRLRLELAADYLVMAAWLAYLKSRLLLPEDPEDSDEPTGEELAQQLAFRLQRLEAMREAAAQLVTRNQLGRDVFGRGMPEDVRVVRERAYEATVFDLLKAYAEQRQRTAVVEVLIAQRPVWSLKDARERLEDLLGKVGDWAPIDELLAKYLGDPEERKTAIASSFGASLELAREGRLDLKQDRAFAPLYMRRRDGTGENAAT